MAELSPLHEHIRILADTLAQIQWAIDGLMREKDRLKDEDLTKTVSFHVLILVSIFIEEWRRLEHLRTDEEKTKEWSIDTQKLLKVLSVVAPATRRIRRWEEGLYRVRSQFLVHPHRNKEGLFVPIRVIFDDPQVPTAWADDVPPKNWSKSNVRLGLILKGVFKWVREDTHQNRLSASYER